MESWHLVAALLVLLIGEYLRRYARRNAMLKADRAPPGPAVPMNFINPFAYEVHLLTARWKKNFKNMGEGK